MVKSKQYEHVYVLIRILKIYTPSLSSYWNQVLETKCVSISPGVILKMCKVIHFLTWYLENKIVCNQVQNLEHSHILMKVVYNLKVYFDYL